MKRKERRHIIKQQNALNKAILKEIGDLGEYYFYYGMLVYSLSDEKIKDMENFNLPSWNDIVKCAKKTYRKFDETVAKRIKYEFENLTYDKDLIINAKDSDVYLNNNNFSSIIINDACVVNLVNDIAKEGGIDINASSISLISVNGFINKDLNLKASLEIDFYESNLNVEGNIDVYSDSVEFDKSILKSKKDIYVETNLAIIQNTKLIADNQIVSYFYHLCREGNQILDAKEIIVNSIDVTNSNTVLKSKLRNDLIELLKALKNKVNNNIQLKSSEETQSISKILKK